ncbi:unnamed protein product [Nesidiocoris tenuis]|uniref:RIIa domain-containing protein n=1 Tax=Nesidiocoris tenuis TaxID=355587 RepID=A0A6H5FY72_9HEMI|nr:unnamed protein product [Nesidiocoris tenuis]
MKTNSETTRFFMEEKNHALRTPLRVNGSTYCNRPKNRASEKNYRPKMVDVPDEFKNILRDFAINYLLDKPSDVVQFGIKYFTELNDRRKTKLVHVSPDYPGK